MNEKTTVNPDGTRTLTRTINDWKPEVSSLLRTFKKHGIEPVQCDDGAVTKLVPGKRNESIEELFACDDVALHVRTPNSPKLRWVYLVYGNSPGELVCDYTVDPALDAATSEHYNKWSERKQPTRVVTTTFKSKRTAV